MPRFPFIVRRVSGDSMLPILKPGDIVIGYRRFKPRENMVVIAKHQDKEIIKRLDRREGEQWHLRGDNPHRSTDSRSFGSVKEEALIARVVYPSVTQKSRPTRE